MLLVCGGVSRVCQTIRLLQRCLGSWQGQLAEAWISPAGGGGWDSLRGGGQDGLFLFPRRKLNIEVPGGCALLWEGVRVVHNATSFSTPTVQEIKDKKKRENLKMLR